MLSAFFCLPKDSVVIMILYQVYPSGPSQKRGCVVLGMGEETVPVSPGKNSRKRVGEERGVKQSTHRHRTRDAPRTVLVTLSHSRSGDRGSTATGHQTPPWPSPWPRGVRRAFLRGHLFSVLVGRFGESWSPWEFNRVDGGEVPFLLHAPCDTHQKFSA